MEGTRRDGDGGRAHADTIERPRERGSMAAHADRACPYSNLPHPPPYPLPALHVPTRRFSKFTLRSSRHVIQVAVFEQMKLSNTRYVRLTALTKSSIDKLSCPRAQAGCPPAAG